MTNTKAAEHLGVDPALSLDEQVKAAQLIKISEEVRTLRATKWTLESVAKLTAAGLAIATAVWAFWLDIPQTKIAALEAKRQFAEDRLKSESEIADLQQLKISLSAEMLRMQELISRLRNPADSPELTKQAEAAIRPQVFLQFAGAMPREVIDGLRRKLGETGFIAPPAVRRNAGQANEVRYLAKDGSMKARAEWVRDLVQSYFESAGCPMSNLALRPLEGDGREAVAIEVTLLHNCARS